MRAEMNRACPCCGKLNCDSGLSTEVVVHGILGVRYIVVWSLRKSLGPLLPQKKLAESCKTKSKGMARTMGTNEQENALRPLKAQARH